MFGLGEPGGRCIYHQPDNIIGDDITNHLQLVMFCCPWVQYMLALAKQSSVLVSMLHSCPDHTKQLLLQQRWGKTWIEVSIFSLEQKAGQLLAQEPQNAPGDLAV